MPDISQLDALFKQTPISKEAEDYRIRVESRQLLNRVVNEPDLLAAKRAATAARTDLQKRELLKAYYAKLYNRMLALATAPEVKKFLEARKSEYLGSVNQPRVRPSPPSPTPTPRKAHP